MNHLLSDLQLVDFTDRLASRAPVPGGGATAALIGALASALAGLPNGTVSRPVTAVRILTRVMLAAAGILFINPGLVTDGAALSLIGVQALIARLFLKAPASQQNG